MMVVVNVAALVVLRVVVVVVKIKLINNLIYGKERI